MANEQQNSAGLPPIDNSTGATANTFYISAGLMKDDEAVAGVVIPVLLHHYQQQRKK